MIKYINGVNNAPEAIGPYSQATIFDKLVFLSGQIPVHPETGEIVSADIEEQTDQVMRNLIAVLGHMGLDFTNVLKSTIYLTDLNDFQKVNNIYSKWMGNVRPARACVQVAALPRGASIEVEVIAVLESQDHLMVPHGTVEDLEAMESEGYRVID